MLNQQELKVIADAHTDQINPDVELKMFRDAQKGLYESYFPISSLSETDKRILIDLGYTIGVCNTLFGKRYIVQWV